ncbi:Metalloendoproteinase [Melia azedarach]|uniref:Metalloendoproteinase n=1 Tax=Melia azedarach TaxID=155640 RepID=A0ACC1Y5X7_MELAZ|nr:Metalloendoproteinase [Melia azedarach]
MIEKPRCGVADIITGTTRMLSGKKGQQNHHGSSLFHTADHYEFIEGNPKWPTSKFNLTYGFAPGTRVDAKNPIAQAFQTWAMNTPFKFSEIPNYESADIKIGFRSGEHEDEDPFDGRSGILAHANPPTEGILHFDADEPWGVGTTKGVFDLESVALHEIGHVLGLGHSSVKDSIMYATLGSGVRKGLYEDDIKGIKALYGV